MTIFNRLIWMNILLMLKRPSQSINSSLAFSWSWVSHCICMLKPDETMKFCSQESQFHQKNKFVFIAIKGLRHRSRRSRDFFFDVLKSYLQVPVSKHRKCLHLLHHQIFYKIMVLMLKNALETFLYLRNQVKCYLKGCSGSSWLVTAYFHPYLYDIRVFNRN